MNLPGPDPNTLRRLAEALPGFVEHREEKRIFRGQKLKSPRKVCQVCGRPFDFAIVEVKLPEMGMCEKCDKMLTDGYQAVTSDNRYAFVKSAELQKGGDKVIECSPEIFNRLEEHFHLEWSEKESPPDNVVPLNPDETKTDPAGEP